LEAMFNMTKPQEPLDDKQIDSILANLDLIKLSKWEFDFVESVKTWWKQRRKLSDKQKKRLGELWEKQNAKP
jgi:hypothetical protein